MEIGDNKITSIVNLILRGRSLLIKNIKDYLNLILLRTIEKTVINRDKDNNKIK